MSAQAHSFATNNHEDLHEAVITATLERAQAQGAWVAVAVRGDVFTGRAVRVLQGRPVGFRPSRTGRPRVVLEGDTSESAQLVLVERIASVMYREHGRTSGVMPAMR